MALHLPSAGARTAAPPRRARPAGVLNALRALPIHWRILSIAALNIAVAIILATLIFEGAKSLNAAWTEVRQVRESDRLLALLESEAGRLQNLIHRYFNQPNPEVFAEITLLREALLTTLRNRAAIDPMLSGSVEGLVDATERFLAGFGDLREVELLVEAGFTPLEAIKIATLNGATFLEQQEHIGSLATGKQADIMLVKGDPSTKIDDIENVELVFKDGVGYDSKKLIDSVKGQVGIR